MDLIHHKYMHDSNCCISSNKLPTTFSSLLERVYNKLSFFSIDAESTEGHICQYVNDGGKQAANCTMKPKIYDREHHCLFATKDIKANEELLYSYGDERNLWWREEVDITLLYYILGCSLLF